MKNIIAIILIIVGLNTVQSQTGILTVDGRNFTVTGARVGVDGAAEYARGYDAGIASTAQAVTMNFVTEPAMSIYNNVNAYELRLSYEVDVVGADKRYDADGIAPAFVYVEFLNTVQTGSTAGQWQDPDYRLVLAYSFRFGDPQFGQEIANNGTGSRGIEDFHTLFVNPLTRSTHARITIQHQSGVSLHRIIPIRL